MFVASPDLADVVVLGPNVRTSLAPASHRAARSRPTRNDRRAKRNDMPPNRDFATRNARRAPRASRTTHLLAFAFALASSQRGAARAEDGLGWREGGTATWYGGPNGPGPDGMSIYTGSCKYGSNIPSHYVAALNTDGTLNTDATAWNFNSENINCAGGYDHGLTDECGACYEVMCVAGRQRGLADSALGPWAGCANGDGEKSITVLITDSCPCGHPNPR